ncbi:MAG: ribonuclease III [Acidimicrobiales bacterium]
MSLPEQAEPASPSELSARLGYEFDDPELLILALTHRSWCSEFDADHSNERLEFLGDAVLGLAVTDHLYNRFRTNTEGALAKVRASVVSAQTLATVARDLDVGPHLRLGRGENASGGREKASILADTTEALIGAVYIDGGWVASHDLVLRLLGDHIDAAAAAGPGAGDYKTRLQELVAHLGHRPPVYVIRESGPDHRKRFHATVVVDDLSHGEGDGTSKKQAEQHAAEEAWATLAPESAPEQEIRQESELSLPTSTRERTDV